MFLNLFWFTATVKTFGGTLTLGNYYVEASLKLIIDRFHKKYQQITRKSSISWHPYDILMAPLCAAATRLRTTDLLHSNFGLGCVCKSPIALSLAPLLMYRVCHGIRLSKRDDYFQDAFELIVIFWGSWGRSENWLMSKINPSFLWTQSQKEECWMSGVPKLVQNCLCSQTQPQFNVNNVWDVPNHFKVAFYQAIS